MQKSKKKQVVLILIAVVLVIGIGVLMKFALGKSRAEETNVITVSTLEKIINVSELSTFTAVYNGIAKVTNDKKPDQIEYYVAYNAKVDAGIDFEKIQIIVDNEGKTIYVKLPEVYITEINVDISSLDFMFFNKKSDTAKVSEQAYKACEEDVKRESAEQEAIFDLAQQNAVNVLTALMSPIVEQLDDEYKLTIEGNNG